MDIIWYQARQDNDVRDAIRSRWAYDTGEDDGSGGTIKRGLKFGGFGDNFQNFKGAGEA